MVNTLLSSRRHDILIPWVPSPRSAKGLPCRKRARRKRKALGLRNERCGAHLEETERRRGTESSTGSWTTWYPFLLSTWSNLTKLSVFPFTGGLGRRCGESHRKIQGLTTHLEVVVTVTQEICIPCKKGWLGPEPTRLRSTRLQCFLSMSVSSELSFIAYHIPHIYSTRDRLLMP